MLAVVAAGFAVLSSPAFAAGARDNTLPFYLDSTNFRVFYQSDTLGIDGASAITQTQAGDIAALAERALAAETADGYPRPLDDTLLGGDGRIDIYVENFSTSPGLLGVSIWDTDADQTSGFIELAGNAPEAAFTQHTIAHELFHLIQFGMWLPQRVWGVGDPSDLWLYEATAEWMGFRVDGYPAPDELGSQDMSLDCRDPFGTDACDLSDSYLGNGYARWPFFEYLIETYGTGFLKDIFTQGANASPFATARGAVAAAVAAKGTTLADVYDNWVAADVRGGYTVPSLQAKPPSVYAAVSTGPATATLPTQKVTVNHLATRILQFDRGGGSSTGPCYAATLTLTVTLPAGTSSKPVFYWNMSNSLTALSVNGSTATASIPWDTCQWPTGHGYLVLPNASTNVDAADFVVKSTLTVDTTPASASTPPPGATLTTPAIPVSSTDPAPHLSVFGPQLVTLAAGVKQIRLIVQSDDSGSLQATLGSVSLGAQSLRIGSNDVRFTVPDGVLQTLRRSASASNMVLTLMPLSASGTTGVAVTRLVSIATPAATKKPATKPVKKSTKKSTKKPVTKKPATKKPAATKKTGTK